MDQLICASLSHTHCWYEVGMLKVWGVDMCDMCETESIVSGAVYSIQYGCSEGF